MKTPVRKIQLKKNTVVLLNEKDRLAAMAGRGEKWPTLVRMCPTIDCSTNTTGNCTSK